MGADDAFFYVYEVDIPDQDGMLGDSLVENKTCQQA
jgi:hypothetical protein